MDGRTIRPPEIEIDCFGWVNLCLCVTPFHSLLNVCALVIVCVIVSVCECTWVCMCDTDSRKCQPESVFRV